VVGEGACSLLLPDHLQADVALVALTRPRVLFVHAKDLLIAAMVDRCSSYSPSKIGSLVSKSHGIALVVLNSRISCIHSSGIELRPSVERRSLAMAFVSACMINRR
jgi:hypothetical protein